MCQFLLRIKVFFITKKVLVYKVPYIWYFTPHPFFLKNLDFLSKVYVPFVSSPFDILPFSLDILGKIILHPFYLFSTLYFPHSHDISLHFELLQFYLFIKSSYRINQQRVFTKRLMILIENPATLAGHGEGNQM